MAWPTPAYLTGIFIWSLHSTSLCPLISHCLFQFRCWDMRNWSPLIAKCHHCWPLAPAPCPLARLHPPAMRHSWCWWALRQPGVSPLPPPDQTLLQQVPASPAAAAAAAWAGLGCPPDGQLLHLASLSLHASMMFTLCNRSISQS